MNIIDKRKYNYGKASRLLYVFNGGTTFYAYDLTGIDREYERMIYSKAKFYFVYVSYELPPACYYDKWLNLEIRNV
jgi:hypothetical protein